MGPGIVDARALLEADLDAEVGEQVAAAPTDVSASASVASLVAEGVGVDAATDDSLDWHRFGPELAAALLAQQQTGVAAGHAVSAPLAGSVSNPELRGRLGLDVLR